MHRHGIACEARHRALGDARVLAEFLAHRARAKWPAEELAPIVEAADRHLAPAAAARPGARRRAARGAGRLSLLRRGRRAPLRRQGEEPREPRAGAFRGPAREARAAAHARSCGASSGSRRPGEFGALVTEARLIKATQAAASTGKPRGAAELWAIRAARGRGDAARRRSRRSMRSTIPARATACSAAAWTPSARSTGSCASTSSAPSGSGSRRPRAPASASSSAAAAASASGRRRPRCTPCARGSRLPDSSGASGRFAGPIGIRERDWRGVEETHVFDRWCYADEPFDLRHLPHPRRLPRPPDPRRRAPEAGRAVMRAPFFVTAAAGTADLLAAELAALGIEGAREVLGGVACEGDLAAAYRACLESRLGLRVLWQIARFPVADAQGALRGRARDRLEPRTWTSTARSPSISRAPCRASRTRSSARSA